MIADLAKFKFYQPDRLERSNVVFLKDLPEQHFGKYYINGHPKIVPDAPGCECRSCEDRKKQGRSPRERYLIPIFDRTDSQNKILSVSEMGARNLRAVMQAFLEAEERGKMMRAQRERAAAFKRSKMIYGAKR